MSFDAKTLRIAGLLLLSPKRFGDARGFFSETYNFKALSGIGITANFVQDNHSRSAEQGTVRGLHFQRPPRAQAKLIRVVRGAIFDVVVDLRRGSPTWGQHLTAELSAENWQQLFVPEGFAHGFCTIRPNTEVLYKTSDYYAPETEGGILWNDPALAIPWPEFAGANLSTKDKTMPPFCSLETPFVFRA